MNNLDSHKDFYKVEGVKFDISRLQESLKEVLKIKNYDLSVSRAKRMNSCLMLCKKVGKFCIFIPTQNI